VRRGVEDKRSGEKPTGAKETRRGRRVGEEWNPS
jgi:hypothetical protein